MTDDLPEEVESLRSLMADEFGVPEDEIANIVDRQVGLDITEIKPDDAAKFEEAWESADVDTLGEIMLEYDVPQDTVDRFLEMASPSPSDGGASEQPRNGDLEKRVNQLETKIENVPTQEEIADSVVHKLQSQMGSNGSAASNGDAQAQQQNNLAPIISAIMQSQSGGGMGSMMEEAAMKSFTRKLTRPSLGEMMEMSMMKDMSEKMGPVFAEQFGDEWAEKYFSEQEREMIDTGDDDGEESEA